MDHSYSTEREKVQKTDHSYFTVAKKTPKVVLRKAQLMKEQQDANRTSIGQDHSYVRPDHLLQLTEFINADVLYADDDDDDDGDEEGDGDRLTGLPQNNAHTSQTEKLQKFTDTNRFHGIQSSFKMPIANTSVQEIDLTGCDLENIDTQISGIRLDHTYDLKLGVYAQKQSAPSSIRSKVVDPTVMCRDQLLSLRLHDHTYLGRSGTKIMDKA